MSSSSSNTSNCEIEQVPFSEFLLTLPKQCLQDSTFLYQYQGFWYLPHILQAVVSIQQQFQALPTDIFICGSIKTGNTWLKSLCFAIATRNLYTLSPTDDINSSPLLTNLSHSLVPFLEFEYPKNPRDHGYNNNLLSTHIPYTSLPKSVVTQGCKIIYICRDPKDTFVSMFHFINRIQSSTEEQNYNIHHLLDLFCEGKTGFGPYWNHVLGYHKAWLERPDKFLFLTYEELKTDTVSYVKEIAAFMNQPFSSEEELEGVPDKIVEMCSFENLRGLETNKTGKFRSAGFHIDNETYFRKGNIGDWKNELSMEVAQKIDRVTKEKLNGSGFTFSHVSTNDHLTAQITPNSCCSVVR